MKHMRLRFFPGFPACLAVLFALILFNGLVFAQHKPASVAREHTARAEEFAAERVAVWRQRLNLEDWSISVVVSHPSDLKPHTLGNIHWDTDKKTAIIRVLDPSDYKMSFDDVLKDIEFTVVHELIHLELSPVLSPLQRNDANRREEEHAVNHMAEALLQLDRANSKTPPAATTAPATVTLPAPATTTASASAQQK
jgi:hypothetical protein